MDREQPRGRWREGPQRGYDYYERQIARERSDFPAAKRGRREDSPGYPSYRDVSPAPGPAYPGGPTPGDRYDRYDAYPYTNMGRGHGPGRGMAGRGYGQMHEGGRAPYPGHSQGMQPQAPPRTIWPAAEPRSYRDAPRGSGQMYFEHELSRTPSPGPWQGPPPPPLQPPAPPPNPRYGSPAHFDSRAPPPREGSHLGGPMRYAEEERRPSPGHLSRPVSRGPAASRGWQGGAARGSGPGPNSVGYGQGLGDAAYSGQHRREPDYERFDGRNETPPLASRGGRGVENRPRSGLGPGRGFHSRARQEQSASAPRDRAFPHAPVGSTLPRFQDSPPAPPRTGSGSGAHASRTSEHSYRSNSGRAASRDSNKNQRRDESRDTSQRQHSSSSRPSKNASGATTHSPMRSSGASRELSRRHTSGRNDSPAKSRLAAATTAQQPEPPQSSSDAPTTTPAAPQSAAATGAELQPQPQHAVEAKSEADGVTSPSAAQTGNTADAAGITALPVKSARAMLAASETMASLPGVVDSALSGPAKDAATAAAEVAAAVGPVQKSPVAEEPPPKRPKLQFGKGLASRMSSAAQSELTLPEPAANASETNVLDSQAQQAQPETAASAQPETESLAAAQTAAEPILARADTPDHVSSTGVQKHRAQSTSPSAAVTTLEELLAQGSPESLSKLSWAQLHINVQSLNGHKAKLQESIKGLSEQEESLTQDVQQAQADHKDALKLQQEQQEQLKKESKEEEARITAELAEVQAKVVRLQAHARQLPAQSDLSMSEEEDAEISSSDEQDSDSQPAAETLRGPRLRNGPNGSLARVTDPMADHTSRLNGNASSLVGLLHKLQPADGSPPIRSNLMFLLQHEHQNHIMTQVYQDNLASAQQQHFEAVEQHLPQGFQPATEALDIPSLPYIKQIQKDYQRNKQAMLEYMRQQRNKVVYKQRKIAALYDSTFAELHKHDTGITKQTYAGMPQDEQKVLKDALHRVRHQVKIPDQILDANEKRHSIFVDSNNQYNLREAREAEQASLQLNPVDQKKFGVAFTKFPKKWGKIAEIMGDRTAFQCAMIYNDQKYEDWFRPTMASYGRNKRRLTGNSKKYLSGHAATPAVPARPELTDKTAKGRMTTVVATAVTSQAPAALEVAPRAGRGKGRGAAAKGLGKGPAPRGRLSQRNLGGVGVATAVLTTTEGEEGAVLDTAAAAAAEPGAVPVVSKARYELDLAWTEQEEQRLMEANNLYPGNMRAIAQHVGSRTQKSVRAQLKKMDAEQAALEVLQQRSAGLQSLAGPGLSAAAPDQGAHPDAGIDDMDTEGPGALETGERLEGSPAPEDVPRQPSATADEQVHLGHVAQAASAASQGSLQQADSAKMTESLLPDWAAAAQAPPPGSASAAGSLPLAMAPLLYPGQGQLQINNNLMQLLLNQYSAAQQAQGHPQQPQGQPSGSSQQPQGQPQGNSQQPQGQPQQPQQLQGQQLSMHPHFMLPYQHLFQMQQAASAANAGGFNPPAFVPLPSMLAGSLGLAAGIQQPLLTGPFGLLPGPHHTALPGMEGLPQVASLGLPGAGSSEQPFIFQSPILPQQAQQAQHGGDGAEGLGPLSAALGEEQKGPEGHSPSPSGATEQPMAGDTTPPVDQQDRAGQRQQDSALPSRADSAPGSSGPPSAGKAPKQGTSKQNSGGLVAKRQMNFWQEDEKAAFINAYKVYGVDWEILAREIPSKEKTQIKNYYQNYKQRLGLDQIELPLTAKHPKATRARGQGGDTSRGSTPRPSSARDSSRQSSENGERIQALMDEALQAAKTASTAAAATAASGQSDPMDIDQPTSKSSEGLLLARDSGSSMPGGSSPGGATAGDVATAVFNVPDGSSPAGRTAADLATAVAAVHGSPMPARAQRPPPTAGRLSPVPTPSGLGGLEMSWGPAEKIRQAWVGGALLPQSSTPPPNPTHPLTVAQDLQQSAQLLAEEELPPDNQLAADPAATSQHGTYSQPDVPHGESHGRSHGVSHGASHGVSHGGSHGVPHGMPDQASHAAPTSTAVAVSVNVSHRPTTDEADAAHVPHSSLLPRSSSPQGGSADGQPADMHRLTLPPSSSSRSTGTPLTEVQQPHPLPRAESSATGNQPENVLRPEQNPCPSFTPSGPQPDNAPRSALHPHPSSASSAPQPAEQQSPAVRPSPATGTGQGSTPPAPLVPQLIKALQQAQASAQQNQAHEAQQNQQHQAREAQQSQQHHAHEAQQTQQHHVHEPQQRHQHPAHEGQQSQTEDSKKVDPPLAQQQDQAAGDDSSEGRAPGQLQQQPFSLESISISERFQHPPPADSRTSDKKPPVRSKHHRAPSVVPAPFRHHPGDQHDLDKQAAQPQGDSHDLAAVPTAAAESLSSDLQQSSHEPSLADRLIRQHFQERPAATAPPENAAAGDPTEADGQHQVAGRK